MKKIVTLLSILIVTTSIFAQKGKVTSALSYKESGNLEKAYQTILIALDSTNERSTKSIVWPRAWEVKGEILQEIFRMGKKNIVDEPLFICLDSYKKAIELDEKGRFEKTTLVNLTFLQTDLSNYAITAYEADKFDVALQCFEKFMEISNLPIMNKTGAEVIDTAIIYNAGLAAYKDENWDKAIEYFKKSAKNKYNGAVSYYYTFKSFQEKKDTLNSINILKESFEAYPDNETIIVELINFYIATGKANDAIQYIDLAIAKQPDNVSYYTAKGSTLERLNREDEAIEVYKAAIEKDKTQFTSYYNLGVIFYNRGVNKLNEASQLPPNENEKFDAKMTEGKDNLKQALPYIERAYELDDSEVAILESLRQIYYRLQMTEKYDAINEKIQSINK
ncbi:MAG: tetratricopeptide repeat protein [Prolixibacteraceae bacterium]|jgi:tetratricopeptide (TPR) repeat protein|nr:tetratricopeptide repeat protein [Prolixibacteraceae bacterium]